MTTRTQRSRTNPDLGMLAGRLLFAVQNELFTALAAKGFDDLHPRHGAVMAYLDPSGVRATDLARLSGQHKQVIGTLVDELERLGYVQRHPDPADRRAKLVLPTEAGRAVVAIAQSLVPEVEARMAAVVGDGRLEALRHDLEAVRRAARHLEETPT